MKAIRVKTKSGEFRFIGNLPEGYSLPDWWRSRRSDGDVLGNQWCMAFDSIELADIVDIQDDPAAQAKPTIRDTSNAGNAADRLAAGLWKPHGVA